jgi:uncharacterized membrane protein YvlD (DUF360 family)
MDLSSLASLGKVAGLGGIALGVVVLLIRPLIDRVSSVPPKERAPTLRLLAGGAFSIGALGIVAWLVTTVSGGNVTAGSSGIAIQGNVSGSTLSTAPPPGPAAPPPATQPARQPQ